jgi:hypothetical protein
MQSVKAWGTRWARATDEVTADQARVAWAVAWEEQASVPVAWAVAWEEHSACLRRKQRPIEKKTQGDLSYSLAGVVSLAFGPIPKAPQSALG